MDKSVTIENLAEALIKFQGEVGNIKKDGTNPFFKSKYATLENVVNTVRPHLTKNNLAYSQIPCGENHIVTILMHSSGEYISATAKMTPKDSSPQAQGSAITYLRRYALSAILGLATEDDDDGNSASTHNTGKKTQPRAFSRTTNTEKEPLSKPYTPVAKDKASKLKTSVFKSLTLLSDPTKDLDANYAKTLTKELTGLELREENYEEIDAKLLEKVSQK